MSISESRAEYIKDALGIMKFVAFHEIYVLHNISKIEDLRENICKDDYFDPAIAFNSLDSFRHNMILPE